MFDNLTKKQAFECGLVSAGSIPKNVTNTSTSKYGSIPKFYILQPAEWVTTSAMLPRITGIISPTQLCENYKTAMSVLGMIPISQDIKDSKLNIDFTMDGKHLRLTTEWGYNYGVYSQVNGYITYHHIYRVEPYLTQLAYAKLASKTAADGVYDFYLTYSYLKDLPNDRRYIKFGGVNALEIQDYCYENYIDYLYYINDTIKTMVTIKSYQPYLYNEVAGLSSVKAGGVILSPCNQFNEEQLKNLAEITPYPVPTIRSVNGTNLMGVDDIESLYYVLSKYTLTDNNEVVYKLCDATNTSNYAIGCFLSNGVMKILDKRDLFN